MNKRSQAKISPFGVGSPALKYGALILLLLISMSCGEPNSHDHTGEAAATYTCPMHPHVVQKSRINSRRGSGEHLLHSSLHQWLCTAIGSFPCLRMISE